VFFLLLRWVYLKVKKQLMGIMMASQIDALSFALSHYAETWVRAYMVCRSNEGMISTTLQADTNNIKLFFTHNVNYWELQTTVKDNGKKKVINTCSNSLIFRGELRTDLVEAIIEKAKSDKATRQDVKFAKRKASQDKRLHIKGAEHVAIGLLPDRTRLQQMYDFCVERSTVSALKQLLEEEEDVNRLLSLW
jgi:DNA replication protein DnaD